MCRGGGYGMHRDLRGGGAFAVGIGCGEDVVVGSSGGQTRIRETQATDVAGHGDITAATHGGAFHVVPAGTDACAPGQTGGGAGYRCHHRAGRRCGRGGGDIEFVDAPIRPTHAAGLDDFDISRRLRRQIDGGNIGGPGAGGHRAAPIHAVV